MLLGWKALTQQDSVMQVAHHSKSLYVAFSSQHCSSSSRAGLWVAVSRLRFAYSVWKPKCFENHCVRSFYIATVFLLLPWLYLLCGIQSWIRGKIEQGVRQMWEALGIVQFNGRIVDFWCFTIYTRIWRSEVKHSKWCVCATGTVAEIQ